MSEWRDSKGVAVSYARSLRMADECRKAVIDGGEPFMFCVVGDTLTVSVRSGSEVLSWICTVRQDRVEKALPPLSP